MDCMSHYQLGHFRRLSTRSRRQHRRRLRACIHISPDIGADIKRLLNKFKLIDKHTESQMVAASAAADGNYRHVLCSNQRSSRHLVKQFAGQMQANQTKVGNACRMLHATLRKCSQPTVRQWTGLARSSLALKLCPQRNGTERVCSADFVAFFASYLFFSFFLLTPLSPTPGSPCKTSFDVTAVKAFELLAFLLPHPLQVDPLGVRFPFKWYDISSC